MVNDKETSVDDSAATQGYAVVTMFGKRRTCKVMAYGKPQAEYKSHQMLWVERAEDEYGIPAMQPPFCVLHRNDWLRGNEA